MASRSDPPMDPARTQVTFYHPGPDGQGTPIRDELRAPDVQMAPVQQAPASSGRLKKAFYDDVSKKTFRLTVTEGNSKRYLALPESAWRDMLPNLRAMHSYDDCIKSITDLSTRQIVAIDGENGNPLQTYQIPETDHERFRALTNIRTYLVDNKYVKASLGALADGYDTRAKARKTFAAQRARALSPQQLNARVDPILERRGNFDNWSCGVRGDETATRRAALADVLNAKQSELRARKNDLEGDLRRVSRRDLRQIEAINRDIAQATEQLAALAHTTKIFWASALLNRPYNHKEAKDWRVPLRMAFDAKMILLAHLTEGAQQPISEKDQQIFEDLATDIAALLIPTTIGEGDEEQSGEAIFRLFYAGGDTLSALVRQNPPAEAGIMPAEPPMRVNLPIFKPVIPPTGTGHSHLRAILAEFHTGQIQPQPEPDGQGIFHE